MSRKTHSTAGNHGLRMHYDIVIMPDGNTDVCDWVELNKGVSILPVDRQRNVYLAREFKYALGDYSLGLAEGIDYKETPRQAAIQELEEELGIIPAKLVDLGVLNQLTSAVNSPQYLFMATKLDFRKTNQEPTEQITRVRMPLEQAVEKAMSGEIRDAPAVAGILRGYLYLQNNNL